MNEYEYVENGHGVGKYGGDYVRTPVNLNRAIFAWFHELGIYNDEKSKKVGKKKRDSRHLFLLYRELYDQWVNVNRRSKITQNEPYITNYPDLQRCLAIERHTAERLLHQLDSMKMITLDDSAFYKKSNKIILKIRINMEERDKMMKHFIEYDGGLL